MQHLIGSWKGAIMDKNIKKKWLKALKSGKYHKTTGSLFKKSRKADHKFNYCCLGVLCVVVNPKFQENTDIGTISEKTFPLYKKADLTRKGPYEFGNHPELNNLMFLNDDHRTWKQVIEYIENEL